MGSHIRNQKREILGGSGRYVPSFFKINCSRILSSCALTDFDLYETKDSMRFIRKTRSVCVWVCVFCP